MRVTSSRDTPAPSLSAMDTDEPMAQEDEGQDGDDEATGFVARASAEPEATAAQTDRDALMAGVAAGNIYLPAGHGSETMELPQASSPPKLCMRPQSRPAFFSRQRLSIRSVPQCSLEAQLAPVGAFSPHGMGYRPLTFTPNHAMC